MRRAGSVSDFSSVGSDSDFGSDSGLGSASDFGFGSDSGLGSASDFGFGSGSGFGLGFGSGSDFGPECGILMAKETDEVYVLQQFDPSGMKVAKKMMRMRTERDKFNFIFGNCMIFDNVRIT